MKEEPRLPELDALRPPRRSDVERRRARSSIIEAAAPLLAGRRPPSTSWDVLAAWARPGLVAAGIAAAVLIGAHELWRAGDDSTEQLALEDVLSGSVENGSVPALLLAVSEPDADAVVEAAFVEYRPNGEER